MQLNGENSSWHRNVCRRDVMVEMRRIDRRIACCQLFFRCFRLHLTRGYEESPSDAQHIKWNRRPQKFAGFFVAVKDEKEKPDPFYIIRLMKLRQDAYDFLKWSRKGNSWVEDENWLYTSGKQDLPWIHWGRKFFTKNAARLTAKQSRTIQYYLKISEK